MATQKSESMRSRYTPLHSTPLELYCYSSCAQDRLNGISRKVYRSPSVRTPALCLMTIARCTLLSTYESNGAALNVIQERTTNYPPPRNLSTALLNHSGPSKKKKNGDIDDRFFSVQDMPDKRSSTLSCRDWGSGIKLL